MEKKVVVYTADYCPHCKRLMRWLDDAGIEYKAKEVEPGSPARIYLANNGRKTIPALEIDGVLVEHEPYINIFKYLE